LQLRPYREFEEKGRPLNVRVQGQFTCNDVVMIIRAALGVFGLACLPDDTIQEALARTIGACA
jgi:hypothetical protein